MADNLMQTQQTRIGAFQESRELAEVKGKMYLARQFPRDENMALNRVLSECSRPELAEVAQYEYPRGDTVVKGPSIRLVEVLARNYGNLDYGINEVDTSPTETTIKAYAWDLETNICDSKTFTVRHERSTKNGTRKLTDERDIYEMVANKGARRKRACILSMLPRWYVDAAVEACDATLKKSITEGKSMDEVRAAIVSAFAEFGITAEHISAKIGRSVDDLSQNDVVKLRHLYSAIKDGFVKASDAFGIAEQPGSGMEWSPDDDEDEKLDAINARLRGANGTDEG